MQETLLTIQKAADLLGVSTKTLRRWEKSGKLIPQRTKGNQRRYALEEISNFRNKKQSTINNTQDTSENFGLKEHDLRQGTIINNQTSGNGIQNSKAESSFQSPASDTQPQASIVNPQIIAPLDSFSYFKMELTNLPPVGKRIVGFSVLTLSLVLFLFASQQAFLHAFNNNSLSSTANGSTNNPLIGASNHAVLGASTQSNSYVFRVNVPSSFADNADFLNGITIQGKSLILGGIDTGNGNINAGTGTITASNVIYSLTPGTGLSVSGGQTPTITNTGVTSLGGSTGAINLTGGTGISLSGLTITNSDLGSSQDIFKNITAGGNTITAGSNNDTLTLAAGTGVTLSSDTTNKTITISSSGGSQSSGWTTSGTNVILSTATDFVGIGTPSPSANLTVNGTTDLTGATTLGSTLGVTGNTTLNGNLNVTGTTALSSPLSVGGNITPSSNGVYDLGSSTNYWNNVYANQIVGSQQSINLTVPATSSATGLSVSMTGSGSGQLASFTFNGTQVLGVGTNDVYLGGKVSQLTDDTNLANANDVFVYDTTKDSDGGQWINSDIAQSASWYNETIQDTGLTCSLSNDSRCGQRQFPQKATIYATSKNIYIFDNKDNTMWMKFSEGTGYAINGTSVNLTSVFALNGVLYVGTSTNGLIEINFLTDKIYQYDYNGGNGGRAQFLGTIADRSSNKGYGAREAWGQIASDDVLGVYTRVINGKTYIAVSTLGGASVIDLSDQRTIKYVDK